MLTTARAKTALRIKREEDAAGRPVVHDLHTEGVYENLRTVELVVLHPLFRRRRLAFMHPSD